MTELQFALFGHPVGHSLSPRIHALFAEQTGVALSYIAIDANAERFAAALEAFARAGGRGANITLPLKQAALALSDEGSELAQKVGAANTLVRTATGWHADNTDVTGLLRDLVERHACTIRQRRVLLIGAGGAARGAAFALHSEKPSELVIVNRDVQRALSLAQAIGTQVAGICFDDLARQSPFDLIVHASAAGHAAAKLDMPARMAHRETVCYDLSYGAASVSFSRWVRSTGAQRSIDGLGMLVEQAADSFALWHGVRPRTEAVLATLRAALALSQG